jgi:hypothetical protein
VNFEPSHWCGCLPSGNRPAPALQASASDDAPLYSWLDYALPTYNQAGPSCVGQAWANWLELMLRRYVSRTVLKPGEQLSGEQIWKRGRELYHGGDLRGGLKIPQGFVALRDLGFIPPDSRLIEIAPDWSSVGAALYATPLVQGHHVHAGWQTPAPQSGCLDHQPAPTRADGYHATLRIGRLVQDRTRFYLSQNSWGPSWGWHGCFLMTEAEDQEGRMQDGPYTIALPAGWEAWQGWKGALLTP